MAGPQPASASVKRFPGANSRNRNSLARSDLLGIVHSFAASPPPPLSSAVGSVCGQSIKPAGTCAAVRQCGSLTRTRARTHACTPSQTRWQSGETTRALARVSLTSPQIVRIIVPHSEYIRRRKKQHAIQPMHN